MQFESGHFWNDMQVALVSCLCALMPLANLHRLLIYILSFGLMPFGWLCTGMLQSVYETHSIEHVWVAVCSL
jgi:hypothetical protein